MEFQKYTRFIHIMAYDLSMNNSILLDGFQVRIDNHLINGTISASPKIPHLFYLPWSPSLYTEGLHTISLEYSNGQKSVSYQHSFMLSPFSTNEIAQINRTLSYSTILHSMIPGANVGGFMLNSTFITILMVVSYSVSLIIVLLLIIARLMVKQILPSSDCQGVERRVFVADYLFNHPQMKGYPTFFKRWLLITSDKIVFYFFVVSLTWETVGVWLFGEISSEFGIQFLWGTVFIPATHSGRYSCWFDTYIWHVLFLFSFWIPLLVLYGCAMVPEKIIAGRTRFQHAVRVVCNCLWLAYFVGIMLVVKLYFLWTTFKPITLLLSPVWCWFAVVNSVLMVRELVYQHQIPYEGFKKETESRDSLIVAS